MQAEVKVKLLVFTTFLTNYTDLLKTKNCDGGIKYFANYAGGRPSKYPGVILQLIRQNPSNALHTKGITIIKTKKY